MIEKLAVMPDHVHLLLSFPPSKTPTSAIKALKGQNAQLFLANHPEIRKKQYRDGLLWSTSYYMSTLGDMRQGIVEKYLENQRYNAKK
ncbi:hypothetical protein FD11_GL000745 [Ligilactobacillus pobuzihii E100301 = KCTC 13174]|uniref:Transposase IS200-like domain-containing protein n=1 Tax=Ligilactobacillus pobuzihii TaxID=449659 RepID=A0A0R2LA18_9LACO|nr:hypothetical protein FD11_GL000745 [Ligilactobacillus pobuzihii E100301 = KCTC 13174]KRN95549.1 hypothetical protein IV66_GL000992 [Ligilactobacillus pobuzihii]GEN48032.1 hypothetical protein LPO01_08240 [Ligilactobacillus pobuzihii]